MVSEIEWYLESRTEHVPFQNKANDGAMVAGYTVQCRSVATLTRAKTGLEAGVEAISRAPAPRCEARRAYDETWLMAAKRAQRIGTDLALTHRARVQNLEGDMRHLMSSYGRT